MAQALGSGTKGPNAPGLGLHTHEDAGEAPCLSFGRRLIALRLQVLAPRRRSG
jgi:hypothetical protein